MRKVVFLVLVAQAFTGLAIAQNVGVQAIGLEKFTSRDTDILAGQLASVPRPMELAVLPFEFRGSNFAGTGPVGFDDPVFVNTRRIATYVLENNPSPFTLSIHLYFAHSGDNRPLFRYSAFRRRSNGSFTNNSAADVAFRAEIYARSLRTAAFLNGLWRWAHQRGIVHRLRLVTIPELEDSAASRDDWLAAQRFIRETYASLGAITWYRRSVYGGDHSRPSTFPYEKHGSTSEIRNIAAGDTYFNDGRDIKYANLPTTTSSTVSLTSLLAASGPAVRSGKSVMYWRNTFNGPRGVQPYQRPPLTPFSHWQYGPDEQTALWIFLNTY